MANGKRGPHSTDTGSWQRPGGDPPTKPDGPSKERMTELELSFYQHFRKQVLLVGSAAKVDSQRLIQAARAAAKVEMLNEESRSLPLLTQGGNAQLVLHPVHLAIEKVEARLQSLLDSMHLGPRARASTRMSKTQQSTMGASEDDSNLAIWKLCQAD